ncbi:MAG: hypothetical protein R6U63_06715 [Longimicrobiales bacterium]
MKARIAIPLFAILAILLGTACASTGARGPRQDPDVISREEIRSVEASNLYDVVRRLRPRWLNAERRSGERSFGNVASGVVVYQNRSYLGNLEVLSEWSPEGIYELRWMDGARASASLPGLGSRHVLGAIIIRTSAGS